MKRFFSDIKKYWGYTTYSAGSALKTEVASSYLNWLWWILDPLLYMLVYIFIAAVVFRTQEKAFPVFIFCGLTLWDFFNRNVLGSIKLVRGMSSVINKVYLPKYVLLLSRMMQHGFKMLISLGLIMIMMPIFGLPFTFNLLHLIPVFMVLFTVTFGISTIMMHLGVFVDDLYNIMHALMRLIFYMCGVFYSISTRIPEPYNRILMSCNPIAFCIDSMRKIVIYQSIPQYALLGIWMVIGILLSTFGVWLIYRYENNYVKVI